MTGNRFREEEEEEEEGNDGREEEVGLDVGQLLLEEDRRELVADRKTILPFSYSNQGAPL